MYTVDIAVKELTPNEAWWYLACGGCKRTTVRTVEGYRCARCNDLTAEPRFLLEHICYPFCSAIMSMYLLQTPPTISLTHFTCRYKIPVHGIDIDNIGKTNAPTVEFVFFGDIGQGFFPVSGHLRIATGEVDVQSSRAFLCDPLELPIPLLSLVLFG